MLIGLMFAALLAITGCSGGGGGEAPTETPAVIATPEATTLVEAQPTATAGRVRVETSASDPTQQVYLRMIHAAPGIPSVSIFIEALTFASNLEPGTATPPTGIVAGSYAVRVEPFTGDGDQPLLAQPVSFEGGRTYYVTLMGTPEAPELSLLEANLNPLNADESQVALINALTGSGGLRALVDGQEIIAATGYGTQSSPATLTPGQISLELAEGDAAPFDYPLTLEGQTSYAVFLAGNATAPDSATVIVLENDVPGRVEVRLLHIAPDLPPVDLIVDGQPTATNIAFPNASPRQTTGARPALIQLYPAGADRSASQPLLATQIALTAPGPLALALMGTPDNLRLIAFEEYTGPVPPGQVRFAFLNARPDLPSARISLSGGELDEIRALGYGDFSAPVLLNAEVQSIYWTEITLSGEGERLEGAEELVLQAGQSYIYALPAQGVTEHPPVIFSDNVGVDESLVTSSTGLELTATPTVNARVRLVNAIDLDRRIDVLIDNTLFQADIAPRSAIDPADVPTGVRNFTVQNSETDTVLVSTTIELLPEVNYSVYIYGYEASNIALQVIEDQPGFVEAGMSYARLVNLSPYNEIVFGLAASITGGGVLPLPEVDDLSGELVRFTVPGSARAITGTISAGEASVFNLLQEGTLDLFIFDPREGTVAAAVAGIEAGPDLIYDVIVYQEASSLNVRTIIVLYPPVSSGG
jgi:hypothetical protein